ncbi:MAG: Abi family protein [Muribaculaceae bacterium]|nr:Abi family protein [Muribaculaceae bacterium]
MMQQKKATTVDRQIAILRERGLIINDEAKAKEILLDIGYYRLGFYWFPFEKSYPVKQKRNHQFKAGAKFEDAVALYYFDNDLRNIVVPYLHRIEVNLRTNIIYHVSNHYADKPVWFSDRTVMSERFIEELPLRYDNLRRNEALRRHHAKYPSDKYAPAWKTLEYMTFGEMLYLFDNMLDENLREMVAARYSITNLAVFSSQMQAVRMLRNVCAHGHNLFDYHFSKSIKPGHIKGMSASQRNDISGGLIVVGYILRNISSTRSEEFIQKIKNLIASPRFDSIRPIIGSISALPLTSPRQ